MRLELDYRQAEMAKRAIEEYTRRHAGEIQPEDALDVAFVLSRLSVLLERQELDHQNC